MMDDMVFDGKQLLTYSIANNINLYGNLSTILLSTDYIKTLLPLHFNDIPDSMRYVDFLYQLLYPAKIVYTYLPLASTTLSLVSDDAALIKDYVQLLRYYHESNNFYRYQKILLTLPVPPNIFPVKGYHILLYRHGRIL